MMTGVSCGKHVPLIKSFCEKSQFCVKRKRIFVIEESLLRDNIHRWQLLFGFEWNTSIIEKIGAEVIKTNCNSYKKNFL